VGIGASGVDDFSEASAPAKPTSSARVKMACTLAFALPKASRRRSASTVDTCARSSHAGLMKSRFVQRARGSVQTAKVAAAGISPAMRTRFASSVKSTLVIVARPSGFGVSSLWNVIGLPAK